MLELLCQLGIPTSELVESGPNHETVSHTVRFAQKWAVPDATTDYLLCSVQYIDYHDTNAR